MVVIAFPTTSRLVWKKVLLATLTTIRGILRYPILCAASGVLLLLLLKLLLLQLELHESLLLLK